MISYMNDPVRGETLQLGFPAKFSDELNFKRSPAPFFGEHTDQVLMAAGYTEAEIQELKTEGVIDLVKK